MPLVVMAPTARVDVPMLAEVREVAVRVVPPIVRLPPRVARLSVTVKVLPDAGDMCH